MTYSKRTLSESELTRIVNDYFPDGSSIDAVRAMLQQEFDFDVDDPRPEPLGDLLVKDEYGTFWVKGKGPNGRWYPVNDSRTEAEPWAHPVVRGSMVAIYRAETDALTEVSETAVAGMLDKTFTSDAIDDILSILRDRGVVFCTRKDNHV